MVTSDESLINPKRSNSTAEFLPRCRETLAFAGLARGRPHHQALVASRCRARYACSDMLVSCRIAHAAGSPPGTVPVAHRSGCRESRAVLRPALPAAVCIGQLPPRRNGARTWDRAAARLVRAIAC